MATQFSTINDLALVTISDHKLDSLYKTNRDAFENRMNGYLIKAIPNFSSCRTPLTYNLQDATFDNDLSSIEISILADLVAYQWIVSQIQVDTQINWTMNAGSFRHSSEAENLKQKSEYADKLRERYSQKIFEYECANTNWDDWANGIFNL